MFALFATVIFALAAIMSLGVLVASYARAIAGFKEHRCALANCQETVTVTVRFIDHAPQRVRVVSSNLKPRPVLQPALLAAA